MVILDGTGSGASGGFTQSVNQHFVAAGKLAAAGPGFCLWEAVPNIGLGVMKSQGSENDRVVYTPNGTFFQWTASGIGDPLWDSLTLQISSTAGQYLVAAYSAIPGTFTSSSGTVNEDIILGASSTSGGVSEPQVPFPASAPLLFGSASYQSPPLDNAQGNPNLVNANWNVSWIFAPVPDENCKDCKDKRGSSVSVHNQSLGEDIAIVGTPFFLHYESDRAAGRAGADLFALRDALSLGGWTLSVHHAFDPLLMVYCAGGSCTPYAIVPKALFLGDGETRDSAKVQAPVVVGSNLELTSEDGSEIYVFDSVTGRHTQTLLPLTGAVLYNFGYDAAGQLITVTDGSGNVTTIHRNAAEHPTSIVSPYGQTTTLAVDANGYLSKVTDPLAHAITLTNSALGLLSSLKDANGKLYSFTYDANGFLTKDSDPAGGALNLARTSTATGYSVTETTAQGRTNSSQLAFSTGTGSTTQQTTNTWPDGLQAIESETQQNGQLSVSGTLPDGASYSETYGPDPRWGIQVPIATSETLKRGNLTMAITRSRVASLSNPADPFTLISLTDTTTINARIFKSVFTAATNTLVDTTAVGRQTVTVLDSLERISSLQLPGQTAATYSYDARGRLSSVVQGTRQTTFAYDANGFVASITSPLNLTHSFTNDAGGKILSETLEDGRVIGYTYDANGNLTSITPPGQPAHQYAYSPVNIVNSYTPPTVPGGGATTFTFSPDREITKTTRPDGQVINYNYDAAGRLSSLVASSSTANYSYNATGDLSSIAITGGEAIGYSYNGNLPTGSAWTGAVAGNISRTFNKNFWEASLSINGGNTVAFTYDKDGFITKAGLMKFAHNAKTGFYTGGTLATVKDTYTYNTFAEPTAHTAKFGTAVLYKAAYTRDNLGRITILKDTIGGATTTYAYTYDSAGRLIAVKKGTAVVATYAYDNNSNRVSLTTTSGTVNGTYDAQDRLLTYGTSSFTYSGNGDLATRVSGTQTTSYQHDAFGDLSGVTLPSGTQISYILDPENNRIGKKINGVLVSAFLYEGASIVAQLDGNNQLVTQFIYGSGSNTPDYMVTGGATYQIFTDHLGSPRLVVDSATGQIAESIDYDEFGNVINDTNPGFQPFGFAGGLYDQDTKLVHFDARDYDPTTGRWTSKDPILFSGGDANLYGYVLNDPVNLQDPSGLEGQDCNCPKQKNPFINFMGGAVDEIAKGMNPLLGPIPYIAAVANGQSAWTAGTLIGPAVTAQGRSSGTVDTSSGAYTAGTWAPAVAGGIASVVDGLLGTSAERAVAKAAEAAKNAAPKTIEEKLGNVLKNVKNPCKLQKQPPKYNGGGKFNKKQG
jgi:RHS repeat-associated protein